jgi:hypothetical protein
VTYEEPERLALQLQALLERRASLRAILEQLALNRLLTAKERGDIHRVIALIDQEMADLRKRLESLSSGPSSGDTGS